MRFNFVLFPFLLSPTDEAFFDSENDPEKCCLLLQFILNCLYKIFLFDTQHFLSKERAEALMMPLVDQVTEGPAFWQKRRRPRCCVPAGCISPELKLAGVFLPFCEIFILKLISHSLWI